MGKTIAEKILSKQSGKDAYCQDIVIANLNFCLGQDGTSPLAIKSYEKMGGKEVYAPEKIALVIDHNSPSPTESISSLHSLMRRFAKEKGIRLYDIGSGVCHQLIPERGHVVPGDLVIGADSHTCSYGAINVAATGVGSKDLAAALLFGKLWFRVPESFKIKCRGKLPKGVYAKDLILYLVGEVTADGANYMSIEFEGEIIDNLSIEGRFTICNMAVEMGAKFGIMKADKKTVNWVKTHSSRDFEPVFPDEDASYSKVKEYDFSKLEPQVAKPHAVDNVCPIKEVENVPLRQAFLGTCTNGRMEDLRLSAQILKGKKVNKDTRLIVAPASREIFLQAMEEGVIQTLISAGATLVAPGCGCCVGTHDGVPSDGERVISTANRNFKGRMGNSKAFIYLASPATVAASAIFGKITDPRKVL